jgi:hypothetical protein
MAWARRMDEGPDPGKIEDPGVDWADLRHPDEKHACRGPRRACEWRCSHQPLLRVCLVARVPYLISYMLSTAMWTTYKCVFECVFGRSCEVSCAQLSLCLVARMI